MSQDLLDRITRHQIFVQRLAGGQVNEAAIKLESIKARLEETILQGDLDAVVEQRYQMQIGEIEQYIRATYGEITGDFEQFGTDFIEYEADFSAKMIGSTTNAPFLPPSPDQLRSAFFTDLLSLQPSQQGRTVMAYMEQFSTDKVNQFLQAIRDGFALGQTGREIRQITDGVLNLQRNQTESLIRTLTNHLANQARQMTFEENEDVLEGYEWISVLDSRTSFICMGRDGTVYPISNNPEISPKPPAHFGCRSTTVPKVKKEFSLFDDDERERIARGPDGKSRLIKKQSYEEWLRKQPKSFQIQVLGPERQKLFEQRRLPLDRFVDPQGRTLTLDELRQLDGEFNGMQIDDLITQQQPATPAFSLQGIAPSGQEADYERQLIDRSDPLIRKVILASNKPKVIRQRGSQGYYSPSNKEVVANFKRDGVIVNHEYGHFVDNDLAEQGRTWWSSNDNAFVEAFKEDRKTLGFRSSKTRTQAIKDTLRDNLFDFDKRDWAWKGSDPDWNATNLSDIIDALAHGEARKFGVYGHGKSYFSDAENRYLEVFANMFQLYGTPRWKNVERIAPNMSRRFVQKMKEVAGEL